MERQLDTGAGGTLSERASVRQARRWATLAGAAAMVAYALTGRSKPAALFSAAALPLAYLGLAGS